MFVLHTHVAVGARGTLSLAFAADECSLGSASDKLYEPTPPTQSHTTTHTRSYPTGGKNMTAKVGGTTTAATLKGLSPGQDYVFVVRSVSDQGTSPEPAVVFQRTPKSGEGVPGAPGGVKAVPGGTQGAVALNWSPPGGSAPDFYQIG